MQNRLLGGLTPREFLRRHWQKRSLHIRNAVPQFAGVLDERQLLHLARRDDVESRIVQRHGRKWETAHGPFASIAPKKAHWTVLVSGVNLHEPRADALLRRFDFVPQARLDDVMVSYATPGGGVGPHVDSYDVFLLQGSGRRRWTVWEASRKTYDCGPGDMLYLPPGVKHDGVALEPCFTYSIGFRAPRGAELGAAFLDWLHERGLPDARYTDPQLRPSTAPARIPPEMIDFAAAALNRIRWSRADVAHFLGEYLSMPKPHVVFPAPKRPARASMVRLDPKTQLLYSGTRFFINGEAFTVARRASAALRRLADARVAERAPLARAGLARLISDWERRGYVRNG
ncbi:MAG TPA: cupin domain-containing protein [Burkholderiales bacterium]|nr:cupin domain-containing protein [Burkholderiales bacterium]